MASVHDRVADAQRIHRGSHSAGDLKAGACGARGDCQAADDSGYCTIAGDTQLSSQTVIRSKKDLAVRGDGRRVDGDGTRRRSDHYTPCGSGPAHRWRRTTRAVRGRQVLRGRYRLARYDVRARIDQSGANQQCGTGTAIFKEAIRSGNRRHMWNKIARYLQGRRRCVKTSRPIRARYTSGLRRNLERVGTRLPAEIRESG